MSIHKIPVPTENQEQAALMQWALIRTSQYPELALLHHIPNGEARSPQTGARLKAMGVKSGVPDLCLPAARHGYHGLYIELKRLHGGRLNKSQQLWAEQLTKQGYLVLRCDGWLAAADAIIEYLT